MHILEQKRSCGDRDTDAIEHPGLWIIPHDIENRTEVNPTKAGLLLSAFCIDDTPDQEVVIVIDNTSVDNIEVFTPKILKRCIFISHNADHEAKYGIVTGFMPMRYACTMVNDRRLHSGKEGYRFDIVSLINRWLGYDKIPIWMDKDIRSEFAVCEFFRDEHILYNAADTIRLKQIYYLQRQLARELGMLYLLNTLNSRIIPEIADTEVRGIKHNTTKWLDIAKDRKDKADKLCQELTKVLIEQYQIDLELVNPSLKKLREASEKRSSKLEERKLKLQLQLKQLEEKGKTHLKSYQTQKEQLEKLVVSTSETDVISPTAGVNWGSAQQVLRAFKEIGMTVPTAKNSKRIVAPSVKKEARAEWFVKNEGSTYEPLMLLFDKFKKIEHNIKSFGEGWVKQYVRDGRIYPSFDQAGTGTGRWTSGSKGIKKKLHPNTSQIPAREGPEYRNCFEADEGRLLVTADWKNQEGVLIISLSGDMEMKKITEVKDQHSFLGTKAWRAVYAHRYNRTKDPKWKELTETYEMNKNTHEGEKARNKFKNSAGLFPVLYGAQPHKVSVATQVTEAEAQLMIDVIKSHAPVADKFLQSNREFAVKNGYVIHNTRSGSRRWFQAVLDHHHYGWPLSKQDKVEIELAGGNSCIQGTGSDLLKEAMAMIALWAKLFKQDIKFVLSNYDEVVYSIPKDKKEQYTHVIEQFMIRAAKNYLIEGVDMECDIKVSEIWEK